MGDLEQERWPCNHSPVLRGSGLERNSRVCPQCVGGASGDVLRITGFPSSPGGMNLASKYIMNACTQGMWEGEGLVGGGRGRGPHRACGR